MFSRSQDFDSVSVCSTASSSCSRDRRSPYNVHTGVSDLLLQTHCWISGNWLTCYFVADPLQPTPPKKPPRRNLSISPTHTVPPSLSSDQNGYDSYEYAFVRINNGQDQNDLNDAQVNGIFFYSVFWVSNFQLMAWFSCLKIFSFHVGYGFHWLINNSSILRCVLN